MHTQLYCQLCTTASSCTDYREKRNLIEFEQLKESQPWRDQFRTFTYSLKFLENMSVRLNRILNALLSQCSAVGQTHFFHLFPSKFGKQFHYFFVSRGTVETAEFTLESRVDEEQS